MESREGNVTSQESERARVVLITAPDLPTARELARKMVEQRLAACVNLVGGVRSIYRWKDAVEEEEEVLMVIKTTDARFGALASWVGKTHPYDVPECLALEPAAVEERYLEWLLASCREKDGSVNG
jgi:periplasmic divalent cation tolerance protein